MLTGKIEIQIKEHDGDMKAYFKWTGPHGLTHEGMVSSAMNVDEITGACGLLGFMWECEKSLEAKLEADSEVQS
jgi:hypothetical protein